MSDNGFADPVASLDDIGGEGESASPTPSFERSPLRVLQSLENKPLQQAMKVIEYIDSARERERKFLRACSPQALNLVATNGPEYLSAVRAVQS